METTDEPLEQNPVDRQTDEQRTIDELKAIRHERHEPGHNRLADFEKQQREDGQLGLRVGMAISKDGQTEIKEIGDERDLIQALVETYGNSPQLYGFEVYENENTDTPKSELDKEDISPDLER